MTETKIVAVYRIKNEEKWIEKSLESVLDISSEVVILDDGSTDDTLSICKKFPNVVDIHHQEGLPFDETRDRNKLLKMALKRNPDAILSLDGDEILMPNYKEILSEELDVFYPEKKIFEFQFLYAWDKYNKIRYDGLYGKTWQSRLFRVDKDQKDLCINKTQYNGNAHCAQIPNNIKGFNKKTPLEPYSEIKARSHVKILHYSLFDDNTRQKKFKFCNQLDPNSVEQDGYIHMISGKGRHSGPSGIELITLPDFMYRKL